MVRPIHRLIRLKSVLKLSDKNVICECVRNEKKKTNKNRKKTLSHQREMVQIKREYYSVKYIKVIVWFTMHIVYQYMKCRFKAFWVFSSLRNSGNIRPMYLFVLFWFFLLVGSVLFSLLILSALIGLYLLFQHWQWIA